MENTRGIGQSVSSRDLYSSSAIPHETRRPKEINSVTWKEEAYDEPSVRREPARVQPVPITQTTRGEIKTGLAAVVTIQNLAPDLTEADVNRLCLNYGRNTVTAFEVVGGSCSAEVSFPSRAEAIKAVHELHGNELDGDGFVLECFLGRVSGQQAVSRPARMQNVR